MFLHGYQFCCCHFTTKHGYSVQPTIGWHGSSSVLFFVDLFIPSTSWGLFWQKLYLNLILVSAGPPLAVLVTRQIYWIQTMKKLYTDLYVMTSHPRTLLTNWQLNRYNYYIMILNITQRYMHRILKYTSCNLSEDRIANHWKAVKLTSEFMNRKNEN